MTLKTLRQLKEEAAYARGFVDGRASVPTDPELVAGINLARKEIERLQARMAVLAEKVKP
jgi:ribosomal protein L7Ae-like RNA K-turn-binding protein